MTKNTHRNAAASIAVDAAVILLRPVFAAIFIWYTLAMLRDAGVISWHLPFFQVWSAAFLYRISAAAMSVKVAGTDK